MVEQKTFKRWHDLNPDLSEAFMLLEEMPEKQQESIASSILEVIKIIRNAQDDSLLISLGKDKILSIYKAYQKRRWYDKNPTLMSAVNAISSLPEEEQNAITQGLLTIIEESRASI